MDSADQRIVTLVMAGALIVSLAMQAIIYALAPLFYHAEIRGTAIGSIVAVGRLGSVTGPLVAGGLIAAGSSGASVLDAMIPVGMVGSTALLVLVMRRRRGELRA